MSNKHGDKRPHATVGMPSLRSSLIFRDDLLCVGAEMPQPRLREQPILNLIFYGMPVSYVREGFC